MYPTSKSSLSSPNGLSVVSAILSKPTYMQNWTMMRMEGRMEVEEEEAFSRPRARALAGSGLNHCEEKSRRMQYAYVENVMTCGGRKK